MKKATLIALIFTSADLLGLLAEYGQNEPDYVPTWNNFFQDAQCNTAQWQYTGQPCDSVQWILYGDTIRDDVSLFFLTENGCGYYQPPCNGAHDVTVRAYLDGTIYERSAVSWGRLNGSSLPTCELDVFDVEPSWNNGSAPFEYLLQSRFKYDLNNDHQVNSTDLLILLSQYGNDSN